MRMNKIELLEPHFRAKVVIFLAALKAAKISFIVYETKRSKETQEAYYAQGRSSLENVNVLRAKAKLYLLTEEENKRIITWTLKSRHLEGKAIDVVPAFGDDLWWNAPDHKWKEIADVAVACGLNPGYYWPKKKDGPHIEDVTP